MSVFMPPQQLQGSHAQQLQYLYSYLYQMAQALNAANETVQAMTERQIKEVLTGGNGKNDWLASAGISQDELAQQVKSLKSLIISTAETVKSDTEITISGLGNEIKTIQANTDSVTASIQTNFEALSKQFGEYKEQTKQEITATATGIIQSFNYDSKINALENSQAAFSQYQVKMEGSIRSGFIDYDSLGVPIIGIAIGQNLRSVKTVINGVEYEKLDSTQACAFYTAEKVSFRLGGREVAYFSNNALHCGNLEVDGHITISGKWQWVSVGDRLDLVWVGG